MTRACTVQPPRFTRPPLHLDAELTIDELNRRAGKAKALLDQALALFPEARALAADDRRRSSGRMGSAEAGALRGVVDAMDARPELFAVLADEDDGHDPNKLETGLLRDRFDRHQLYAALGEQAKKIAGVFGDTALAMGALVKPVARAGYEIAKPIGKRDPVIADKLAAARDYYGANAAASAESRKANKVAQPK